MRRLLLVLFVALQLLLPSFSYATAFPVVQPTIQPKFPTMYPSASAMPPGGGGTGSINNGKGIAAGAVGAVAAAICLSVDCTSSIAAANQGIAQPPGWPAPATPTSAPQPPGSVPSQQPVLDPWMGAVYPSVADACAARVARYLAATGKNVACVPTGPATADWGGRVTFSPQGSATCPSGYLMNSSGSCSYDTTGASGAVKKPAGTPCQVLLTDGSPRWDTSNPECTSRGAGPWTDADGNKETLDTGAGTFSVVSSDGKNNTKIGPAAGNGTPITQDLTGADANGNIHKFHSQTVIDKYGNIATQDYTIDGFPVSQDEYNKTLAGSPPSTTMENSKANPATNTGSGSTNVDITCEKVGTCGVAQDSTLKDVAAKAGAIQTSLSDFFKNFTTAVSVPQLYTPSSTTAQSALSDFSGQIKATPIVTSVTGFFDVSFQGGACPTWTIPVVSVMGLSIGGIEIDQFCTPTAYHVYSVIAVVTLVVCGFFAFHVAVDN